MDSIGNLLKAEREKRGLSLEDAHENTKITVQSISALEEDRFDSFPNKVYARAFLRDYANFLGLDSGELLTQYEEQWSPKVVSENTPNKRGGGFLHIVGFALLGLVVAAGLAAGCYFGWQKLKHERRAERAERIVDTPASKSETAVIPKAPPVEPPKPEAPKTEAAKTPAATPKPPAPAVPQTQTLEVTTTAEDWIQVTADGKTAFIGIVPKGKTQSFQGKTIFIRSGKAGAVQLKLNGQLQPPLEGGTLKRPGETTFKMPPAPKPVAPPAPGPTNGPTGPAQTH